MDKKEKLDLIELYIDETNDFDGVEAISIVEDPAIMSDFIALSKHNKNPYGTSFNTK